MIDPTLAAAKWPEPRWPGDSVRQALFCRADELGDVRIQQYGIGIYLVAAYLPVSSRTRRRTWFMIPDRHEWVETAAEANEFFDIYIGHAKLDGWIAEAAVAIPNETVADTVMFL